MTLAPKLRKGAIIGVDIFNPLAAVTIFQYNPETLTRRLDPQYLREGGGAPRFKGAPVETIDLEVTIDAVDQMEKGEGGNGIYPQLSALEMLVYPKSALVIANMLALATGTMEIVPPVGPLTLFVWGPKRVLPVKVTSFSINEKAHDSYLIPIRAEVSLSLQVLSYNDLPVKHPGNALFVVHQVVKEVMATLGSLGNMADLPKLL